MDISWEDIICDEEFRATYGKCPLKMSGSKKRDNQ